MKYFTEAGMIVGARFELRMFEQRSAAKIK